MPLLESHRRGLSSIKMRPRPGQSYITSMNIQCPKAIREENEVGTIFYCDELVLSPRGTFYRAFGNIRVATHVDRMRPIKGKKVVKKVKRKKKDTAEPDVNIYDVL